MSDELDGIDPKNFQPGTFGCHEALHVSHMLAEMVDSYLCSHPAIQANPEWKAQADLAAQTLADLYQAIGAAHLSAERVGEDARPEPQPREVHPEDEVRGGEEAPEE